MTARIRDMLHTKEQLLLDVSHELRSPLARLSVALEIARKKGEPGKAYNLANNDPHSIREVAEILRIDSAAAAKK